MNKNEGDKTNGLTFKSDNGKNNGNYEMIYIKTTGLFVWNVLMNYEPLTITDVKPNISSFLCKTRWSEQPISNMTEYHSMSESNSNVFLHICMLH